MAVLSRKQREIAERHSYFLSIARQLMQEEGFHQLSMDRVAEVAEYSKGTVYQHFNCKEEMLGQLCISALQRLEALGRRALQHKGPHRERLLAFFVAHEVWQQTDCDEVAMMQNYYTDQVLEKLTDVTRSRHAELETGTFNMVKTIVEDAMAAGELPRNKLAPADIVFSLWALTHGGETLRSYKIPWDQMGVNDPGLAIVESLERLLDGMGWEPLSDGSDTLERIKCIQNDLFKQEIKDAQLATQQT